jgi:AcrR family transcriptional regulator/DNA-binding MarR family transcriptional regulator
MAAQPSGESDMPERRSDDGARYVSDVQRGRMLSATFALVGEQGYAGLNARSVSERAGVSNRTFYQCFGDREDCFLAAFNHAVDGLELELRAGWESELGWTARVRAALALLLRALDREPAVGRLVFVEALAAGPRVLSRRARALESLAGVVDRGRENPQAPAGLPGLVAEGVVGATFGVIHARLLELRPEPLLELLGQLMATIVLPYRGTTAAAKELGRRPPRVPARQRDRDNSAPRLAHPTPSGRRGASGAGSGRSPGRPNRSSPSAGRVTGLIGRENVRPRLAEGEAAPPSAASPIDYRLTVRTQMALAAVAGRPGLNNREVSEIIGLADKSQISRMMKRLCDQGLVENTLAHSKRQVMAWRLTSDGEAVIDAHRSLKQAQRTAGRGGKLAAPRSAGDRRGRSVIAAVGTEPASTAFRMTALTHEVLTVVATLGKDESNPTNREIARAAGVKDEGQISKLLARLEGHGLLKNAGGHPAAGNAWQLTERGAELLAAGRPATPGAGQ